MSALETKAWLQHYTSHTPHHLDYGDTTLLDTYKETIASYPTRTATNFFGRTLSYAEIDKQVRRCAAGLRAFGVRPGDTVAIVLPNCPQHIIAFWAVLHLGATVVEHNPLYTAHELHGLFKDHGARVAICWDKSATTLDTLRDDTSLETIVSVNMVDAMPRTKQLALKLPLPMIRKTRDALTAPAPNTVPWEVLLSTAIGGDGVNLEPAAPVTKDSIALILYTSGTTGAPKGALLSHANLYANLLQGMAWVKGLGEEVEKCLAALPLFHAYGMTMLATLSMHIGGELILLPTPRVDLIINSLKKDTPTWVPGVPTLYEKIVDAAEKQNIEIKGIRNSFSGASTLPVSTVERWEKATKGLLVEGYGLTECSPIIVGNPMSTDRRPGYVGIPFPDTEVKIVDPDNPTVIRPDGEEGEILVRGPQVFSGYLNNPEATEKAFVDGWYRTGDVGIMEPDGFIRLVARIKEVIITGGFNVYPAEVEDVIRSHPDVREVAVVGRPRSRDGSEDVVACITLNEGAALDPEGLKEYCRERLTRYKVPRTFYHFEELAHDQLGKIRRRDVHEQLLEILDRGK